MSKNEQSAISPAPVVETLVMGEAHTKLFDTDTTLRDEIVRVHEERQHGNMNNRLPVVDVSIPGSIVIDCPLLKLKPTLMRSASHCKGCKHFDGIVQTAWSDEVEIDWSDKYGIRCGYVLERKTRQVVIE